MSGEDIPMDDVVLGEDGGAVGGEGVLAEAFEGDGEGAVAAAAAAAGGAAAVTADELGRNDLTCPICGALWSPRENRKDKQLRMSCVYCGHDEPARSNVVYQRKLKEDKSQQLHVYPTDMVYDPTLQRTRDTQCPKCGQNEAVFFMEGATGKDQTMKLVFMCVNATCHHKWIS